MLREEPEGPVLLQTSGVLSERWSRDIYKDGDGGAVQLLRRGDNVSVQKKR